MSLDVYLKVEKAVPVKSGSGIFIRRDGQTIEITREEWDKLHLGEDPVIYRNDERFTNEVFHSNITHNLNKMAEAAGIYKELWHPDELGIKKARQLIEPLKAGLQKLFDLGEEGMKVYEPQNGWGTYETLVKFVTDYISACERFPDADVDFWG